jgi:DNA-binding XRE family transcriptional regulator
MVEDLGLVISKYRNMRNLSQEKLADEVGVSRQSIVNWEENKSLPSLPNFIKLSEELRIPMEAVIDDNVQIEIVNEINLEGGLVAIFARQNMNYNYRKE